MTLPHLEREAPAASADHHGSDRVAKATPLDGPSVRASLVGPQSLCTAGIVAAVAHSRFTLVLQCDSLKEFQAAGPQLMPTLCIFAAPGGAVQRSVAQIADLRRFAPALRIVAVSTSDAGRDGLLSAGADRHVSIEISPDCLLAILDSVMELPSRGSGGGENDVSSTPRRINAPDRLSAREIEVIAAIARGQSNKGVARQLSIAEPTVKAHVRAILKKTGVANRTQAALWLARRQRDVDAQVNAAWPEAALSPQTRRASWSEAPLARRTGSSSSPSANDPAFPPNRGLAGLPAGGC